MNSAASVTLAGQPVDWLLTAAEEVAAAVLASEPQRSGGSRLLSDLCCTQTHLLRSLDVTRPETPHVPSSQRPARLTVSTASAAGSFEPLWRITYVCDEVTQPDFSSAKKRRLIVCARRLSIDDARVEDSVPCRLPMTKTLRLRGPAPRQPLIH